MTEKLHDGFSLIELMVALGISTTILTLAFLTYGKIYTDSAKLEKYLKDEIIFQDEFAGIYRGFQNSPGNPPTPSVNFAIPAINPSPPILVNWVSGSQNCGSSPPLDCWEIKKTIDSDEHTAYIYWPLRP